MCSLRTLALTAVLLAASTAAAGEVKIAWYGQSYFQIITPKGTRVVLDPHNLEAYRITPIKADVVLMSHLHNDHNVIEGVIENAKEIKEYNALKKVGQGGLVTDWNQIDEKVADVRFFSVPTYHDESRGMTRGKNGVWVIDIDGLRIVHLGDLGHTLNAAQLKKLGKVDVLMVPVGGVYTLNGLRAFEVFEQIKPTRCVIPMHYGTVVYDDLLPLKTTSKTGFQNECEENEYAVEVLKPKEWLRLETRDAAPKKARVVVPHYMGPGMGDIKLRPKDKDKDAKDKDDK